MRVVDSAVAAMDAHRGVAAVAENGLCFLTHLSLAEPNRVRRQVMSLFVVIWGCGLVRGVPLATRVPLLVPGGVNVLFTRSPSCCSPPVGRMWPPV